MKFEDIKLSPTSLSLLLTAEGSKRKEISNLLIPNVDQKDNFDQLEGEGLVVRHPDFTWNKELEEENEDESRYFQLTDKGIEFSVWLEEVGMSIGAGKSF